MARWKVKYLEGGASTEATIEADSLWLPDDEEGFVVFHEGVTMPSGTSDKITFVLPARRVMKIEKA